MIQYTFRDFQNYTLKNTLDGLLSNCESDEECFPIIRICANSEKPSDLFFKVGGFVMVLLLISFIAAICLYHMGNYYTLYKLSKGCGFPILHPTLLHDIIGEEMFRFESEVEEIKLLIDDRNNRLKVWQDPPIDRMILNKNMKLTCFFYIIGKGWIDLNEVTISHIYETLQNNDELVFDKGNWFEKWLLLKTTNQIWFQLFYKACAIGESSSISMLIDSKSNLNLVNIEDGKFALHYAVELNSIEAVQLLMSNKHSDLKTNNKNIDINVRELNGGCTPLHIAAWKGFTTNLIGLMTTMPLFYH